MPRPRNPRARARALGADLKDPKRYRGRGNPAVPPLGAPSPWLSAEHRVAWGRFRAEFPWLAESDRALVEIGVVLRADSAGATRSASRR